METFDSTVRARTRVRRMAFRAARRCSRLARFTPASTSVRLSDRQQSGRASGATGPAVEVSARWFVQVPVI